MASDQFDSARYRVQAWPDEEGSQDAAVFAPTSQYIVALAAKRRLELARKKAGLPRKVEVPNGAVETAAEKIFRSQVKRAVRFTTDAKDSPSITECQEHLRVRAFNGKQRAARAMLARPQGDLHELRLASPLRTSVVPVERPAFDCQSNAVPTQAQVAMARGMAPSAGVDGAGQKMHGALMTQEDEPAALVQQRLPPSPPRHITSAIQIPNTRPSLVEEIFGRLERETGPPLVPDGDASVSAFAPSVDLGGGCAVKTGGQCADYQGERFSSVEESMQQNDMFSQAQNGLKALAQELSLKLAERNDVGGVHGMAQNTGESALGLHFLPSSHPPGHTKPTQTVAPASAASKPKGKESRPKLAAARRKNEPAPVTSGVVGRRALREAVDAKLAQRQSGNVGSVLKGRPPVKKSNVLMPRNAVRVRPDDICVGSVGGKRREAALLAQSSVFSAVSEVALTETSNRVDQSLPASEAVLRRRGSRPTPRVLDVGRHERENGGTCARARSQGEQHFYTRATPRRIDDADSRLDIGDPIVDTNTSTDDTVTIRQEATKAVLRDILFTKVCLVSCVQRWINLHREQKERMGIVMRMSFLRHRRIFLEWRHAAAERAYRAETLAIRLRLMSVFRTLRGQTMRSRASREWTSAVMTHHAAVKLRQGFLCLKKCWWLSSLCTVLANRSRSWALERTWRTWVHQKVNGTCIRLQKCGAFRRWHVAVAAQARFRGIVRDSKKSQMREGVLRWRSCILAEVARNADSVARETMRIGFLRLTAGVALRSQQKCCEERMDSHYKLCFMRRLWMKWRRYTDRATKVHVVSTISAGLRQDHSLRVWREAVARGDHLLHILGFARRCALHRALVAWGSWVNLSQKVGIVEERRAARIRQSYWNQWRALFVAVEFSLACKLVRALGAWRYHTWKMVMVRESHWRILVKWALKSWRAGVRYLSKLRILQSCIDTTSERSMRSLFLKWKVSAVASQARSVRAHLARKHHRMRQAGPALNKWRDAAHSSVALRQALFRDIFAEWARKSRAQRRARCAVVHYIYLREKWAWGVLYQYAIDSKERGGSLMRSALYNRGLRAFRLVVINQRKMRLKAARVMMQRRWKQLHAGFIYLRAQRHWRTLLELGSGYLDMIGAAESFHLYVLRQDCRRAIRCWERRRQDSKDILAALHRFGLVAPKCYLKLFLGYWHEWAVISNTRLQRLVLQRARARLRQTLGEGDQPKQGPSSPHSRKKGKTEFRTKYEQKLTALHEGGEKSRGKCSKARQHKRIGGTSLGQRVPAPANDTRIPTPNTARVTRNPDKSRKKSGRGAFVSEKSKNEDSEEAGGSPWRKYDLRQNPMQTMLPTPKQYRHLMRTKLPENL